VGDTAKEYKLSREFKKIDAQRLIINKNKNIKKGKYKMKMKT